MWNLLAANRGAISRGLELAAPSWLGDGESGLEAGAGFVGLKVEFQ